MRISDWSSDVCSSDLHFRGLTKDRIAILISHRFSTVRMADQTIVIQAGRIIEHGSHDQLIAAEGHYAHLFSLQPQGYRCLPCPRRSFPPPDYTAGFWRSSCASGALADAVAAAADHHDPRQPQGTA